MSRPVDLPVALQNWAKANYVGGPLWGGTPQRAAPAGTTLTPGVSLPAENANYLYGNVFDAAQGAINAVGQMAAQNWGSPVAPPATITSLSWSDIEQAWYGGLPGAGASSIYRSPDYGKTWAAQTVATNTLVSDIAFDTNGNGVIVGSGGTNIQSGAFVSYGSITWTNNAGAIVALSATQVIYEPTSALWCLVGDISATGFRVYTSSNRTAWTAQTIPSTWSTSTLTGFPQIGAGNGLLVACFTDTGGTAFRTMRSSNGGVTWTNDQSVAVTGITLAGSSSSLSRPVWSPTDGLWYIAANALATRKTQVFSSPDAITWTSAASLTTNDVAIRCLTAIGSLLIGANDDGRLFCSWTKGTTWFRLGYSGIAVPTIIRAGGGGWALMGSGTTVVTSTRFGLPSQVV